MVYYALMVRDGQTPDAPAAVYRHAPPKVPERYDWLTSAWVADPDLLAYQQETGAVAEISAEQAQAAIARREEARAKR